jgi:2'-5' RNA ligase
MSRFAVVAYVNGPVAEFVQRLRRELHPELPHLATHVTVLPPRQLEGSETSALETLEGICRIIDPFEVLLEDVETFVPITPTVFIRVGQGASRLTQLHDRLNTKPLGTEEEWPYMPHLTIVKMGTEEQAQEAHKIARERWTHFKGSRNIEIKELTFVREDKQNDWIDLSGVPLGGNLVNR